MSIIRCALLLSFVLFPVWTYGQERPAQPARPSGLPIKRVVLYKNGVGYFEHLGSVRDNQDVTISFTSGQLNDVLKSLTVLDLNGGRITGVAYGSANPVDKQLGDLRLPLGDKSSLTEFLGALRGARLEVRSGTNVIAGRLLSVERKTRIAGGTTLEVDYLSLINDAGDVRTTELSPSFSVRLLEQGLTGKVDRYLDLVSSSREADVRRMVVSTAGTGNRSLFVSYISEVPVWKATYRIVLGSKPGQSPLLQGWAIIDNTVGQDWEKVQLSLVAGAPQSFIQNLSQPYYSRRPVVPLPQNAAVSPQTFEATLRTGEAMLSGSVLDPTGGPVAGASVKAFAGASMVGETTTNAAGVYEFQTLPEGSVRVDVDAPGFRRTSEVVAVLNGRPVQSNARLEIGTASESVQVTAGSASINTETSMVGTVRRGRPVSRSNFVAPAVVPAYRPDEARARAQSAALAQELGDLFEYKLKEPITILKNRSALVPIVQSSIVAEKVSVWNDQAGLPRPQRALWLNNSTGLTLDGGSFSVMEEETFAGEGIFDPIRPDEKRFVSYAMDLAVNAGSRSAVEQQRVTHVRVSRGTMTHQSEIREEKTYTFRNEDASARTIIVEHPMRAGYELRGDVRPAESTAGWMRFRVRVESKQTASLVVEEVRPLETSVQLTNIDAGQIALFVRARSISPTIEAALRGILAQKDVIAKLNDQAGALEEEKKKIDEDQGRIRDNMEVLKGSAEERALLQRYTRQLDSQENRLEVLKKETEQLGTQLESAQAKLDSMIEQLSFDEKL